MTTLDDRPAIVPDVRVRLYVSDCPDRVSGIVTSVYSDAAGQQVADVRLSSGAIATRNLEFLTVVDAR